MRSLWIGSLGPVPPDPSNRVADDPRAAELGHRLFFDPQLSADGRTSCATCHEPGKLFTDGRVKGKGSAGDLSRHTPGLVGVGFFRWFDWDGRHDSAWAQALAPIESPREMNATRVEVVRLVVTRPAYRSAYEALFGPVPDLEGLPERAGPDGDAQAKAAWAGLAPSRRDGVTEAFVNIGKAIAAYERHLRPGPSAFDKYVEAIERGDELAAAQSMSPMALGGLKLFLSSNSQCVVCHNGPLFSDGGFRNIGTGRPEGPGRDLGRSDGIAFLLASEFNCRSRYSDSPNPVCPDPWPSNPPTDARDVLVGAYKVPGLRNVAATAPYMHDGRFATLTQVVDHYRNPRSGNAMIEFRPPFDFSPQHVAALVAFLETLDGPIDAPEAFLRPPADSSAR